MLKINADRQVKMSLALASKGAEGIIAISNTIGAVSGILFPEARVRANSIAIALKGVKSDIGEFKSNERFYDKDVTNTVYSQFHYTKQDTAVVVEKETITVYSNMAKNHYFMFFPIKVNIKDKSALTERIHQCMMCYRTENELKNMHFRYNITVLDDTEKYNNITRNLFKALGKKEAKANKKATRR